MPSVRTGSIVPSGGSATVGASVDVALIAALSFTVGAASRERVEDVCSFGGALCVTGGLARIERSAFAPDVAYRVAVESVDRLASDELRAVFIETSVEVAPVCVPARSPLVEGNGEASGSGTVVEKMSLVGRAVTGTLPFGCTVVVPSLAPVV